MRWLAVVVLFAACAHTEVPDVAMAPVPTVGQVGAGLTPDEVSRGIATQSGPLRDCWNWERYELDRDLVGDVFLSFVIQPSGGVIDPAVLRSTVEDKHLDRCVKRVVDKFRFPAPRDGGRVIVTTKFHFEPK